MIFAALVFSLMHAFIKELKSIHISQIIFFRASLTSAFCIAYLKKHKISILGNQKGLLIQRALFGLVTMTLFFITIKMIPLGASVSLKYLSPIFTIIFAAYFLKEKVRLMTGLLLFTAMCGVLLLKGYDTRIDFLPLFLGVLGSIFAGLVYMTIRKIGKRDNSMVIINYFMFSATVFSAIVMIPFWKHPTSLEWFYLISIGVIGCFGQIFMTKGFQIEKSNIVAPIRYLEVVFSLIIGLIWFKEEYPLLSFFGILIILISVALLVIVSRSNRKKIS